MELKEREQTELAESHKQGWFYKFLRGLVRVFTKPMKTVWELPFEGRPSVCNHDRAYGPMAMCAHFELSEDIRPWINAEVLSPRTAPAYIRKDYWWDLKKWYSPILSYTAAYIYALVLPLILHGSDCVPVYHDTGVMSTLRNSIKTLTGYCTYGKKIFDGFVSVGRLYYARTKEIVDFYPTHVDWKTKTITVGKPIAYDPSVKYEEQVTATCSAIEEYFASFDT